MGYKIYCPKPMSDESMELLRKKGFEFIGIWEDSHEAMMKYMAEADVAIARVHFFSDEMLAVAKNLKLLQVHGVGYQDHVVCEDAAKRGIYVAYSPYGNHETVAEGAVGLTIALTKHICEYNNKVRTPEGIKAKMAIELSSATVGVLGLGNIARAYAHKMHYGMDSKIIAYDPYITKESCTELGTEQVADLDELIRRSDYITVHTPITPETRGMISTKQFQEMKEGAIVINCARGGIIDEAAGLEALKSGKIAGFGLDVLSGELAGGGLGDDARLSSPLFGQRGFLVSPHLGGSAHEAYDAIGAFIVGKIAEAYGLKK